MSLSEWAGGQVFKLVHGHNLVYNTCWEDPRLDRQALKLAADDTVLVITSAGCNALDYALAGPKQVVAVDMNPRQNALLDLKLAGIRHLDYEDFFAMFGEGKLVGMERIYADKLRPALAEWPRRYWDRWIKFFDPENRRPFYFRGTCGAFAMLINVYINRVARLRPQIDDLLRCATVAQQREIYERHLRERIWSRSMRFAMRRDAVLSLLGVPQAQRHQIETQYPGGINSFLQDCTEAVFARLPLSDNYFWRVYMTGRYTQECCPEYLKPDNFQKLRDGLADRVQTHTDSVEGFLTKDPRPISRFVLLDHMDWLSTRRLPLLAQEWQWIVRRAAPGARILWRSAGLRTDFVDRARIVADGQSRSVGEMLTYDRALAEELHCRCRVHTYGSFHIADLAAEERADMSFLSDLRVLYHMVAKPVRGKDHAARLESFYAGQAEAYDDFRRRLLQGREAMYRSIPVPKGGVWVDLGGGTGANLEPIGDALPKARKVYLVDLCDSLLAVARKRCEARGWKNVEAAAADATTFQPDAGKADVVTFSYSLTMIPDWFAAIDNALAMLRPGGTIGVTDFFVARKHPAEGLARQSWFTRTFWPAWFGADNVFLSPDHVPYLQRRFHTVRLDEHRAKVPYIPLIRVPYYTFIGRKAE